MVKATETVVSRCAVTGKAHTRVFCKDVLGSKSTSICRGALVFDPDGNTNCIHKRNGE